MSFLKKRLLLVDISNLFMRSYVVNPSLGSNDQLIGGLLGSLKSLVKITRETTPLRIVIIYDGQDGSRRRRFLHNQYKQGRQSIRLNRHIAHNYTEDEAFKNRIWQITRLHEYLDLCPVIQIGIDGVEADDIIAYLCKSPSYQDWQKVIVSADKDFIQLLNKKTLLYRPSQNEILNVPDILERYGIHPNNFALARAIDGDKSDNIKGIERAGLKTLASRFQFLKESKQYCIEDIIKYCYNNQEKKIKLFDNILANKDLIEHNINLMELRHPKINQEEKDEIEKTMKEPLTYSQNTLVHTMSQDECTNWNFEEMFEYFNLMLMGERDE